jgi:hypothetical protein
MPYNYKPTYTTGSLAPESAQKTGLGTASNILASNVGQTQQYKDDISGQLQGPATGTYAPNVGYDPMKTVGGLTGGDYEKLQTNLQQPIYSQGAKAQQAIKADYGGRGLYGSVGGGLMSGAQASEQEATQNALANAVAQRYALQQKDIGQQMQQNEALFRSGAMTADQANEYNRQKLGWDVAQEQAQTDFSNAILQMQNQYGMDKQGWQQGIDDRNFQNALALAGLANPAAAAGQQAQLGQQQLDAANQQALYGGIGKLAGGLLGSYSTSGDNGWNLSGVSDDITNWWNS